MSAALAKQQLASLQSTAPAPAIAKAIRKTRRAHKKRAAGKATAAATAAVAREANLARLRAQAAASEGTQALMSKAPLISSSMAAATRLRACSGGGCSGSARPRVARQRLAARGAAREQLAARRPGAAGCCAAAPPRRGVAAAAAAGGGPPPGLGPGGIDPNGLAGLLMAAALQLQQAAEAGAGGGAGGGLPGGSVLVRDLAFHPPGADAPLLDGVSFRLPPNQLGLIIGRSGSGKTTLLQLLAGLSEQTRGDIFVHRPRPGDHASGLLLPTHIEERMQQVGLVFQFPERHFLGDDVMAEMTFTWPRDTAFWGQRSAMAVRMQRVRGARAAGDARTGGAASRGACSRPGVALRDWRRARRPPQVIDAVGLGGVPFNISPSALSGGQQRRLALALQLVRAPGVLLLDEPLAGLDWRARREVVGLLRELKKEATLLVAAPGPAGPPAPEAAAPQPRSVAGRPDSVRAAPAGAEAGAAPMASMAEPKVELADSGPVPGATRVVDTAYDFTDADQIGEGTYGKVYRGTDRARGDKVALKMIRMDNEKEGFPITAIREIKLLSMLKHENIVNLREIVRSRVHRESKYKGDIFMVFDYAEHDLTGMMDAVKARGGALTVPQIKCIMLQLLKGLAYCHMNGILHRDLKASNLLINRRGALKIADFGLARNYATNDAGKLTNRVITLWYRPPELLLGAERYGPEVDVWSVGCIFAELLARKPLFPGNNEQQQLDWIFKLMGAPSEQNWPGVSELEFFHNVKASAYKKGPEVFDDWCRRHSVPADAIPLLKSMLCLDPSKRITATDAALSPYFFTQEPLPCNPRDLPSMQDCHEWTAKKRKQQHHQQQQQQQQHPQHQQQQQHHGGHHQQQHHGGHHAGGAAGAGLYGAVPTQHGHGAPYGHAGAGAAGGGYGAPGARSVRPRTSGPGGPPGGAPGLPLGPGQPPRPGFPAAQGFNPAVGFNPAAAPPPRGAPYGQQQPAYGGMPPPGGLPGAHLGGAYGAQQRGGPPPTGQRGGPPGYSAQPGRR
ncbi:CDKC-1 [Scenedesmus sp. PABB004]|nr:CDKC-1 [Scenedesmus sp. PABB004]